MGKALVIGALGQIGTELVEELRNKRGEDQVLASDIRQPEQSSGPFVAFDASDPTRLERIVDEYGIDEVYHLAAILSAKAEQSPLMSWNLNMDSLFNVLELGRIGKLKRIFWPSSIAVFGPTTPRNNAPQVTITEPNTVYGISKLAGERWCEYYHQHFKVDVRSVRYPGLIGYKSLPGGGTTDYAVEIFHQGFKGEPFSCFLKEDTTLPMMYMPDAIRATVEIMEADPSTIKIRSSYNLSGMSFTPVEIYEALKVHFPDLEIRYEPDFRQAIADSWPGSIDDSRARADWNWKPQFGLEQMCMDIVKNLPAFFPAYSA